jgi:hypothetical protein
MITTHSLVHFTVRTLVFTVHTLLIIMFSLQYLLLLMEVLFSVLFTDSVFTVHHYINTVQVLFTDYTALDLLFLQYILLIEFLLYIIT